MNVVHLSLVVLAVTTVVSAGGIVLLRRRGRDGLNLRTLLVVDYVITYAISGFAHLLQLSPSRGYYEAVPGSPYVDTTGIMVATITTPLALAALGAGLSVRWFAPPTIRRRAPYSMADSYTRLTASIGLLLTGAAAVGVLRMRGFASEAAGDRIIGVDGGMARFAFLASWMPWGVVLLALVLLARRKNAGSDMWNTIIMAGAMGVIAVSGSWAGGRTDIVVFTLPLLIVMMPWLRGLRTPLLVGGAFAVFVFVRSETLGRVGTNGFDVASLLDWQWGRFSMVAWAGRYVSDHGLLGGETLASGFLTVPFALLHFFGVRGGDWSSIVQVSGEYFSGSDEFIFVVPGMTAELFTNFGYLGVVIGYLVLGLAASLVADAWLLAQTELGRVLLGYFAAILLFQTITAQSGASTPLVIMTGAPIIGFTLLELFLRRHDELREKRLRDPFVPLSSVSLVRQWRTPT